jgi:xylose dehydrogenase (NAD/NADP)
MTSDASRSIRWGVMSTANIGRAAVNPAIQTSSNGSLVAVASRDLARAEAFAAAHGIPTAYGSYEALLGDENVDAVYIPLPNSMHHPWVIRATQAGKHVLCEKPLALSAAECVEMEAAARDNDVLLMEAFMYRFHPRMERVVEMVRGGAVGELKAIRSSFTFRLRSQDNIRLDPDLGGGALMDVGCYCVNVSRTAVGEEPTMVQATADWTNRGVDEFLAGMMRFPSGAVALFDCALTMERSESFEVAGTDGYLTIPAAFLPGKGDVDFTEVRGREPPTSHDVPGADEYQLMVEHFASCVLNGEAPRYPVSEAAANMRVIEALYRSARAGGAPAFV